MVLPMRGGGAVGAGGATSSGSAEAAGGTWNLAWLGLDESTDVDDADMREEDDYLMVLAPEKWRRVELDKLAAETHFHRLELSRMYKAFKRECPSGKLHRDEFVSFYKDFFPNGDASSYANLVYDNFDHLEDGAVSFEAFMKSLSASCRGSLEERLNWSFKLYDADHDGFVSREDMTTVFTTIYAMFGPKAEYDEEEKTPELRTEKLFKMLKVKGDKISFKDFLKGCKKHKSIRDTLNVLTALM